MKRAAASAHADRQQRRFVLQREAFLSLIPSALQVASLEVIRTLARQSGCGRDWIDRERRVLAAVVLVASCTLEQAEAALAAVYLLDGVGACRGDDRRLFRLVIGELDEHRRPKFRLIHGGAS